MTNKKEIIEADRRLGKLRQEAAVKRLAWYANQMSYKQLRSTLKNLKQQGLTTIKLNSTKEILEAEYKRITGIQK